LFLEKRVGEESYVKLYPRPGRGGGRDWGEMRTRNLGRMDKEEEKRGRRGGIDEALYRIHGITERSSAVSLLPFPIFFSLQTGLNYGLTVLRYKMRQGQYWPKGRESGPVESLAQKTDGANSLWEWALTRLVVRVEIQCGCCNANTYLILREMGCVGSESVRLATRIKRCTVKRIRPSKRKSFLALGFARLRKKQKRRKLFPVGR
jgi:hypothetical protein